MLNFLFWNLNKKPLESIVSNLSAKHDVDILILAECEIPTGRLLETLFDRTGTEFYRSTSLVMESNLQIYSRFSHRFVKPVRENSRTTIHRLSLPPRPDILLAAAHMPSKLHWSAESLSQHCFEFAQTIQECEEDFGHQRTLLVGDLNMNPFEAGMVSSTGFNATMARHVAKQETRTVQEKEYPFFYNPMWGHFGKEHHSPPGTYYRNDAQHVTYFWNMLDQVLIRPVLLDYFPEDEVKILTTDGVSPFLTQSGIPDKVHVSDHLPIVFALSL